MVFANEALIQSLARPGGNVTGTTSYPPEFVGKAVGLLRELVPAINREPSTKRRNSPASNRASS